MQGAEEEANGSERDKGKEGAKKDAHLHSLDLQLQRRILINHNHRMWMQLQTTQRPHMIDTSLDALLQRQRLVYPRNNDNHFPRLQHGLDTHRQSHLGNLLEIVAEESTVGDDGVISERLDTRARCERGPRLVEGDVTVWSDSPEEEVDAAGGLDRGFVGETFGFEVWSVAVEDMDVARVDVHVGEEVRVHERVVGFGVLARDADVFILGMLAEKSNASWQINTYHIESNDILK